MSHTPGPWIADMDAREIHVDALLHDMRVIAEICRDDAEGSNTRLIGAAPDLLDALKEIAKEDRMHKSQAMAALAYRQVCAIARAAVAKAEAQTPPREGNGK